MRTFGKWLGRGVLLLGLCLMGVWFFGPREAISLEPVFVPVTIGADVEAHFARQEARFADITPGVEKRVVWAGDRGAKTRKVIVYVHGFSATSEEIRPVPDRVAAEIGANLVFTRLRGHGRRGRMLAEASVQDWMTDLAEALVVARRIGDEIVLMATSTGATLAAEAILQPEMAQDVVGMILLSPNFAIADPASVVLTLPLARHWVPFVAGKTRSWRPTSQGHAKYWTHHYPTAALFQMAGLVAHARAQDYSAAAVPVLMRFSDADSVVDHRETRRIAATWGGPMTLSVVEMREGDDPSAHVIAGDIMSPGMTAETVEEFVRWIKAL